MARDRQGSGRHDAPDKYGAWYCSLDAVSAVAESIQFARGQILTDGDLVRPAGAVRALVELRLAASVAVPDLDDPRELVVRRIRPSQAATLRRAVTQRIASSIFDEGAPGFLWWSTLEAEWINATLFHERVRARVSIAANPQPLSVRLEEVRDAAGRIGVRIDRAQS